MRCLVTGASGFIGGHLVERLVRDGHAVRGLVRGGSDTSLLRRLGAELVVGDLGDPASLAAAVRGCGAVVHCGAVVSDWGLPEEIRRINVDGTRNLMEAAGPEAVDRFVHLSSTDVYGYPGDRAVEETRRPARFANWYAQTKLMAEDEVRAAGAAHGLDTVILRPATVYGPRSVAVIGEMARAIRGGYMLSVRGGRPVAGLCYVENLVDAIVLALEGPNATGQAFNVTDGLDVTWRQFTGDLADGLGCRRPWLSLPYPVANGVAFALEHSYRVLRRATGLRLAPLLSRQAVHVLGKNQDFSNRKAGELLGWEPRVAYRPGLEATIAWLRSEYLR